MKSKLVVKILIDIIMILLFTFLSFGYDMSALLHEVLGITIFILFIIHLLLNISLIKQLFKSKKLKSKALLFCDILLTVGIIIISTTGVIISKYLFINTLSFDYTFVSLLHNITSYICLAIMGIHLLFHTKYFVLAVKAIIKNIKKPVVIRALAFAAVIITVLSFLYIQISPIFISQSQQPEINNPIEDINTTDNSNQTTNKKEEEEENEEDDKKTVQSSGSGDNQSATVTLQEYLSKLFCTGCSKHCPLTAPQCRKGNIQADQAEIKYYNEYGDQ